MAKLTIILLTLFLLCDCCMALFGPFDCRIPGPIAVLYKAADNETSLLDENTSLDSTKPTTFIIHGWLEDSKDEEYPEIARDLYLVTRGNVILVDYYALSHTFYLSCAYTMVRSIGNFVIQFILKRMQAGQVNPNRVHIIGFSIGAHTAGYIGRKIKATTGINIKRITALDPAGPLFSLLVFPLPLCLSASDADLVDALHTTIYGSIQPVGTVDFYVRGFLGLPMFSADCGLFSRIDCSHALSKRIFRESILSCAIVANHWLFTSDTVVYGYNAPLTLTGLYTFVPNSQKPYGKGNTTCIN